jgi:hypothetical protein
MKKLLYILMAAALLLTLSTTAAWAQTGTGKVTGKAVRWNGDAIAGATIRALTGPLETDKEVDRTTTAADGSYALTVPAGQPYWVHIDTFGSWWGYSYQTPFTLQPNETISQVFFALGPRDVKEITLPAPVSNVGPATGENQPPQVSQPPAQAPKPVEQAPAPQPNAPVSNVKPEVGSNPAPAPAAAPKPAPRPAPQTLPNTGDGEGNDGLWLALTGALVLVLAGLTIRQAVVTSRR